MKTHNDELRLLPNLGKVLVEKLTLYAIEGAIQGIRWHNLEKSRKEELKEFFGMVNK